MIGVAMRQHDRGYVGRLDAGGFEIFRQLSRRWLVARPGAHVDQDQGRLPPDHDDIVDELELVASLSCCFQGCFPLGGGQVRRNKETGRQNEMTVAHHDCFEVCVFMDGLRTCPRGSQGEQRAGADSGGTSCHAAQDAPTG